MHTPMLHRIAAPFLILTVGALSGTACSDAPPPPTAVTAHSVPAVTALVPSAHGTQIRQRVADKRAHHLSAGEVARVKSLRGKWQWAADRHHAVMQEAMHDPTIGGLRKRRPQAERCDIAVRYLRKHFAEGEARSGKRTSAAERDSSINSLASRIAGCTTTPPQPSFVAVGPIATAWQDYVVPMAADLRTAKDLADATEIMDSYLATASVDPDVPPASLALIAGTIDLATSSANEWDAYARPREGSLFMWGWLDWVAGVVFGDASGCIAGVGAELDSMGDISLATLGSATETACFGGALIGSIFAAL